MASHSIVFIRNTIAVLPKCCAALERLNNSCRLLKLNYLALFIVYCKIIYGAHSFIFYNISSSVPFPSSQFLIRTDERVILTVPLLSFAIA